MNHTTKRFDSLSEALDFFSASLADAPEETKVNVRELLIERDALLADKKVMAEQIANLQEKNNNQRAAIQELTARNDNQAATIQEQGREIGDLEEKNDAQARAIDQLTESNTNQMETIQEMLRNTPSTFAVPPGERIEAAEPPVPTAKVVEDLQQRVRDREITIESWAEAYESLQDDYKLLRADTAGDTDAFNEIRRRVDKVYKHLGRIQETLEGI